MKINVKCTKCTKEFSKQPNQVKKSKNHFCSRSCAATYNNKKYPKRSINRDHPACLFCNKDLISINKHTKYCSNQCQFDHKHALYIERWLNGEETGNKGTQKLVVVSRHVKRWLRETRGNRCQKCRWCEINPVTQKVPVEADHIDGNAQNTTPENLQLICPNCHSLTPTFRALNTGNGRMQQTPV